VDIRGTLHPNWVVFFDRNILELAEPLNVSYVTQYKNNLYKYNYELLNISAKDRHYN
jgi:hypothetical protein